MGTHKWQYCHYCHCCLFVKTSNVRVLLLRESQPSFKILYLCGQRKSNCQLNKNNNIDESIQSFTEGRFL